MSTKQVRDALLGLDEARPTILSSSTGLRQRAQGEVSQGASLQGLEGNLSLSLFLIDKLLRILGRRMLQVGS
jgi:hypothetical protein